MKIVNLFCLPFAGGNRYSYKNYEIEAPPYLNIIPLEYPGRGTRVKELLKSDVGELIDDLYGQIFCRTGSNSYALYGHSMGGLLAYLLARKILENKRHAPLHVFISGTSGPSSPARSIRQRHLMGKAEFLQEIKDISGMPEEIMENEELINFLEPILRADFTAIENYTYEDHEPLEIPFTVIYGDEDEIEIEDLYAWKKETKFSIDFVSFPGAHFFINTYPKEIVKVISGKLYHYTKIDRHEQRENVP